MVVTAAEVGVMRGASPLTLMLSETWPTWRMTFCVVVWATRTSTLSMVVVLKPWRPTLISYIPMGRPGKVKLPVSEVVVLRARLLLSSRISTEAPRAAAPVGSVTSPVMVPLVLCPAANEASKQGEREEISRTHGNRLLKGWVSRIERWFLEAANVSLS